MNYFLKFALFLLLFSCNNNEYEDDNNNENKNLIIKKKLNEIKKYNLVDVTMYTTDAKQTDETPYETASGFIIDSINPKKHRIIAVSHDLKKKLKWGQKVKIEGIGKWNGIYYVRDLMHKRWKNKIDILINPYEKAITFRNAKLYIK